MHGAVYSMLDNSYINTSRITEENVLEVTRQGIAYNGEYKAKEIYVKEDTEKPIYYIYGTIEQNLTKTPVYFVMYQDIVNASFYLKPISQADYSNYSSGQTTETFEADIELTEYNKISNITVTDEEMAEKYFTSYIQNARHYTQEAYNSLDEEYRNARFGSYENYLNYLSNKSSELESLDHTSIRDISEFASEEEYSNYIASLQQKSMTQYYMYTENDINYCVCTDSYGNYYIFRILDVMNYKLMLDTYTINTTEFLTRYEEAETDGKVALNINKVFEAINNKDFNYVYNKLDANYKNSYFSTLESFSTFMSNNLFEKNEVEFDTYEEGEDSHKYSLIVRDASGENKNQILMTVTMQLGEDTDFTIKFE